MVAGGAKLKNLRQLRTDAGITQQKLADEIGDGMTQPQIQNYETGKYSTDISTMIKIADVFDTSLDYLVGRTTHRKEIESVNESGLTEKEQKFLERYRRLIQSKRRSLEMFFDTLDGGLDEE